MTPPSAYIIPGLDSKGNPILAACKVYGVTKADILGSSRKRQVVTPRQVCMWWYYVKKENPYSSIYTGKILGNKHHATVVSACKQVNNLIETDKEYRDKVELFLSKLI